MQDKVMPSGKWEFDKEVTNCFGDMLNRSIPNYDVMRSLCYRLGVDAIEKTKRDRPRIIDLGCSNGLSVEKFVERYGEKGSFHLYDVSEPMAEAARKRFEGKQNVAVYCSDFVEEYPWGWADLTLSVLTLQFTPLEYRQQILRNVYKHTATNGAFILVEKVLGEDATADDILVQHYYGLKSANGYTEEQIQAKRKALRGVLVPLKAKWNEELLREAGFKTVTRFWQCLNFVGWIAYK